MENSYSSSWAYTKARSKYHFDYSKQDAPGEWFFVLGRFENCWAQDLKSIKDNSRPMTWENRKYTINRSGPVSPMLEQEENDIMAGGGDPKMTLVDVIDNFEPYPQLQKIINFFELDQVKTRLHVQKTGQVFNMHIDKLDDLYPDTPWDKIIRFAVMLDDWQPGQFYQYGT